MPELVQRRRVIVAGFYKPLLRRQVNRIRGETVISSSTLKVLDFCRRGLQQFFSLLNRIPVIRALRFQWWNSVDLLRIEHRGRNHFWPLQAYQILDCLILAVQDRLAIPSNSDPLFLPNPVLYLSRSFLSPHLPPLGLRLLVRHPPRIAEISGD